MATFRIFGRHSDILWASPECTNHSQARLANMMFIARNWYFANA